MDVPHHALINAYHSTGIGARVGVAASRPTLCGGWFDTDILLARTRRTMQPWMSCATTFWNSAQPDVDVDDDETAIQARLVDYETELAEEKALAEAENDDPEALLAADAKP
jgi:hypothetical protein